MKHVIIIQLSMSTFFHFSMGQNLNIGQTFFTEVLFRESEVLVAAKITGMSITDSDKWLYPEKPRR